MIMFLKYLISALIINFVEIIVYHKVAREKIRFNNLSIYYVYVIQTILVILNYTFVPNLIKVILTFFIMIVICKILFIKKKWVECINVAFVTEIIVIISEFIFALVVSLIGKYNNEFIAKIYQGQLLTNIMISILCLSISNLKISNTIFIKLTKISTSISKNILTILFGLIIITSSLLFNLTYYDYSQTIVLFINTIIIFVYFIFVVFGIRKEYKYVKVYNKYATSLEELEEYETIINEFRIINHENENQLNTIKGFTNNKKVHEYIDEIFNNKVVKNKELLKKAMLIPSGGLRGLIYSKLVQMKNYNIDYSLSVDKSINSRLINSFSTKDMYDICQIIGVYLDNAIEEVKTYEEKNITIRFYKDSNINIEITNCINHEIKTNEIEKVGYTTKNQGHGYGLNLVNSIIKDNKMLRKENIIGKNFFTQKLIVKK